MKVTSCILAELAHLCVWNTRILQHYFIALQKVNCRDLFVKVDGYDNRSYADVQKKMEETIASLDPESDRPPWALFCFGWDPELIPDLPRLSKEVLNFDLCH